LALYGCRSRFYPSVITTTDETGYVHQAQMMLQGSLVLNKVDPISGASEPVRPGTYPPGTALLMRPSSRSSAGGGPSRSPRCAWRSRWSSLRVGLRDEGRSALFASSSWRCADLVMSRLAMSDVPSAALVRAGLWLFWRGLDRGPACVAAGFVAGLSPILRRRIRCCFVPLFAGTVVRRENAVGRSWSEASWARRVFAVTNWVFGHSLYQRTSLSARSPVAPRTLLLYGLGLLILVPGGFVLTLAYRGRGDRS